MVITAMPRMLLVLLVAAALLFGLSPAAEAFIYWSGFSGRADLDGSNLVADFVGAASGCGMASDGNHLYFSRPFYAPPPYFIGRASLPDGKDVDPTFISLSANPGGVAVDGAHIYWTSSDDIGGPGTFHAIGRANLDGSNVDENFIPTGPDPEGVAVGGGHIYWTISDGGNPVRHRTIGRADLDGSNVDENFIVPPSAIPEGGTVPLGTSMPWGLAVDATHIFWTSPAGVPGRRIGRANLNGTGIDESFVTEAGDPRGIAVDAAHLYWADEQGLFDGPSTIGRVDIDGSNVDQNFIPGLYPPCGLAVDGLSTPPTPPSAPAAPAAPASGFNQKAAIKECKKKHPKGSKKRKRCVEKAKKRGRAETAGL